MLHGNRFWKTSVLCFVFAVFFFPGLRADEVGMRKDGSLILMEDDGSWMLLIPSQRIISIAVNKRGHKLWSHPALEKHLKGKGKDPEDLSSQEARTLLNDMREAGLEKYRDKIEEVVKGAEELLEKNAKNKEDGEQPKNRETQEDKQASFENRIDEQENAVPEKAAIQKNIKAFTKQYDVPDVELKEFQAHYYAYIPLKVKWPVAEQICEMMGGHLVTITSKDEQNFVESFKAKIWIGFTDVEKEDNWKWVTDEEVNFKSWAYREPNNAGSDWNGYGSRRRKEDPPAHYAALNDDGDWRDFRSMDTRHILCEWDDLQISDAAQSMNTYAKLHVRSAQMSDAQWNNFAEQFKGQKVTERGIVQSVQGSGDTLHAHLSLSGKPRDSTDCVLLLPRRDALNLEQGQKVAFKGRIKHLKRSGGALHNVVLADVRLR